MRLIYNFMIKGFISFFESFDSSSIKEQREIEDILITMRDLGFSFEIRANTHNRRNDKYSYKCEGRKNFDNSSKQLSVMEETISWVNEASIEYLNCIQRLESMGYDVSYTLLQSTYHRNFTLVDFKFDISKDFNVE